MKIIENKKNDLAKRKEIKGILTAEKNPGFEGSLKSISEHFKSPAENIVIKEIKSKFGRDTFLISAFIYDSVSDKELFEPKKKVKKGAQAK